MPAHQAIRAGEHTVVVDQSPASTTSQGAAAMPPTGSMNKLTMLLLMRAGYALQDKSQQCQGHSCIRM